LKDLVLGSFLSASKLRGRSAQWGLEAGEVILFRDGFYFRIDLQTGIEKEKGKVPHVKGTAAPCVFVFPKQRFMAWFSGRTNLLELLGGHVREEFYLNYAPIRKHAKAASIPIGSAPNAAIILRVGVESKEEKEK